MPPRVVLGLGTLATIVVLGAGSIAIGLPVEVFVIMLVVVFFVAMIYAQRWIYRIEERAFDIEANRVATPIRCVPGDANPGRVELAYRDRMRAKIVEFLGARDCTREHRLNDEDGRTKTKVDLVARVDDVTWYVTIKVGLNAQTRKILQGEVEDIILALDDARDRGEKIGDARIMMVVATHDDDANAWRQLRYLYQYAQRRMTTMQVTPSVIGSYRIEVERTDWPRRTDRASSPRAIAQPA